jgi:hypothetical protein
MHYGQCGNSTYATAPKQLDTYTITNGRSDQTVTLDAIADKNPTNPPFTVNATASSGNAVYYALISGPASILGNTVTLTGDTGIIILLAATMGDATYNSAKDVAYIKVSDAVVSNAEIYSHLTNNLTVYPVPAKNTLHVDNLDAFGNAIISLCSSQGSIIFSQNTFSKKTLKLDLSNIPAGLYILKVETKSVCVSRKVVIQ